MVVVLTGKNTFALQTELRKIIAAFRQKYGDSVERFDGVEMNDADGLLDAVRSISFLEPRKLVVVRDFAQNSTVMDKAQDIVEQTADSTDLVLVDQKLDKRTASYNYLKKQTDLQEYRELASYELEKWLISQASEQGAELGARPAKMLVERVGADQQLLYQEIQKLSLRGGIISTQQIEELVEKTPQSKVFDLLDAVFQGSLDTAWELYVDQRAQGEEPHKIIGMITWQLQQLTLAVYAPIKTREALVEAGMSGYSAGKVLQMARQMSRQDVHYYVRRLAEIDAQSKTTADVESALETYFSEVASRRLVTKRLITS